MSRNVVLDANVLVGILDQGDVLHARSMALIDRLKREGRSPRVLDVFLAEALSVLTRRAFQRKTTPPDLGRAVHQARAWRDAGEISFVSPWVETCFEDILGVMEESGGALNFNDALLVVLQRAELIEDVASFDSAFDRLPDFRRIDS